MEPAAKDAPAVREAATDLDEAYKMVKQAREDVEAANAAISRHNSPSQEVNVGDRGGEKTAMYILLAASALILGMNLAQMGQISELKSQVRRLEDYQMTTFMLVPELRKQVEQKLSERKEQ